MTTSTHDPIEMELPGYLVDLLTQWVRADTEAMRLSRTTAEREAHRHERAFLGDQLARGLLHALPNFSAEGDFADALNERDEVYAEHPPVNLD